MALGADQNLINCYKKKPIYYIHKLDIEDFKDTVPNEFYQLYSPYVFQGQDRIPEFSEIYTDENEISLALDFRNQNEVELSLFGSEHAQIIPQPANDIEQIKLERMIDQKKSIKDNSSSDEYPEKAIHQVGYFGQVSINTNGSPESKPKQEDPTSPTLSSFRS